MNVIEIAPIVVVLDEFSIVVVDDFSSGQGATAVRKGSESLLWELLGGSSRDLLVVFGWVVVLIVLISVLIWLVVRIRTRFRGDEDPTAADHSMLLQLPDLRRHGDLSEEEVRSIKGRLVERIDKSMSTHKQ